MRWFLSITLLTLFALAACSNQPVAPTLANAPTVEAQTVVVYKAPT
jgi:hypothetical protein